MSNIKEHEGKKYLRVIVDPTNGGISYTDVYAVIDAFGVTCPASAHAIKKLLAPGQRGKGERLDDLVGAQAAINRAVELERARQGLDKMRQEHMEKQRAAMVAVQKEMSNDAAAPQGPILRPTGQETVETIPLGQIMEQSQQIKEETAVEMKKIEDELKVDDKTVIAFKEPDTGAKVKEEEERLRSFKINVNDLAEQALFGHLPEGAVFLYEGRLNIKRKDPAGMSNAQGTNGGSYILNDTAVVQTSREIVELIAAKMPKE